MSERCVFCNWKRMNAGGRVRFFGIPKDPGIKRVKWLQVIGKQEIRKTDRVCSLHFHKGQPSNDPSHPDFVPHLCLEKEAIDASVIKYLESESAQLEEGVATTSDETTKTSEDPIANLEEVDSDDGSSKKPNILRKRKAVSSTVFTSPPGMYRIKNGTLPYETTIPQSKTKNHQSATFATAPVRASASASFSASTSATFPSSVASK